MPLHCKEQLELLMFPFLDDATGERLKVCCAAQPGLPIHCM